MMMNMNIRNDKTSDKTILNLKEMEKLFQLEIVRRDAVISLFQELSRDVISVCEAQSVSKPIEELLSRFDKVEQLLNAKTEIVDNEPQFNT